MNQEIITNTFHQLIEQLMSGHSKESDMITQLTNIAREYRNNSKEFITIILARFKTERLNSNKIKLFNIVDSLFKTIGQDYIDFFSPVLFDLFRSTYIGSNENGQIRLFKIFYTWKYIIDKSILDQINTILNFEHMKLKMNQMSPGKSDRYDQFNENVREQIMKDHRARNMHQQQLLKTRTINNQVKRNSETQSHHSKEKDLSEPLFSESSPSNHDFSDVEGNEDDNERKSGKVLKKVRLNEQKKFAERDEDNGRYNEKNKNIEEMKQRIKKVKTQGQTVNIIQNQGQFLANKRTASPLSHHSQNQFNKKQKSIINTSGNNMTNVNTNNAMTNQFLMMQSVNQNNPNSLALLQAMSGKINMSINNIQQPSFSLNNTKPQQTMQMQQYPNRPTQYITSQTETSLSQFILNSSCNVKESYTFFSSLSKFFTETYKQSKILPTTKNGAELFKSKELYEPIHKYSYNMLFLSLKNICADCGFRTKIYPKLIEHLDIHFHYNYLKKNSNNKVLCRKEGCDKNSWITNSYMKNNNAYTLNSILYYQNDSDQVINNVIYKAAEIEEDNEDLLYPVQYGNEMNCLYCGDQFKKKYFSKYHYWFYVNVVNITKDEVDIAHCLNSNNAKVSKKKQVDKDKDKNKEVMLLHESCIDEYLAMVSHKYKEDSTTTVNTGSLS